MHLINTKSPSQQLTPLGAIVYTSGSKTPIYNSNMDQVVGHISNNQIAIVIDQSYNDQYICVLTSEGLKGWILCDMLTLVK